MVLEYVRLSPDQVAELDEERRGRKPDPDTVRLFEEALKVSGDTYCYVGDPTVYETTEEAWKSVQAVVNYAKRRDFKIVQRIVPVLDEDKVIGYRCVIRAER